MKKLFIASRPTATAKVQNLYCISSNRIMLYWTVMVNSEAKLGGTAFVSNIRQEKNRNMYMHTHADISLPV